MHMSKAGMALCVSQGSFILASQCYEGDPQQVARMTSIEIVIAPDSPTKDY